MNVIPQARMTVDEFLAWAHTQPGKSTLHNGTIFMMSPEGAGHAKIKGAVHGALVAEYVPASFHVTRYPTA